MGISINGPSGIDTKTIIDTLVGIEQNKVTKVERAKASDQLKIDAYSKVRSFLTDIKTKAAALSKASSFDLFQSKSSNEKAVTATGGAGTVDGSYDVKVFQLASNEKMISRDGFITSQTAALSSLVTPGVINVDGVDITIDNDDTIQDLRMKINTATKPNGDKLGVSASVVKMSDTNFRLVLSSKTTGTDGIAYRDVSGNVLQGLGIVDATGSKGNVNQIVRANTAFEGMMGTAGNIIQFAGTDHNGNNVNFQYTTIPTTATFDAAAQGAKFLEQVEKAYNGTVEASFETGTGNLILTDNVTGSSKLALSSLTVNGTAVNNPTENLAIGVEGAGVLNAGRNSFFSLENIYMSSTTNSVSGAFTGVTFDFHSTSVSESVNINLTRDADGIQKKFQELIDSYNSLVSYAKSATKYADPDDEESTDGELAGDSTLMSMVTQIRSALKQEFGLFGTSGKYTNLTMFGLKTDVSTGQFSVDATAFKKGLETHFDDLVNIFSTLGVSENTSITLGRSTADTKSGKYNLEEVDAEHLRIQLQGSTEWYTSDARLGDIVNFSDGPVKGLTLTAPTGSVAAGGNTFTFSKGISTLLDDTINKLNNSKDGLISLRQESWRKSIDQKVDRIDRLEDQIERYRLRLTSQYAAMEKAMSDLTSQAGNVISAFQKSQS
jgi:flagellar hook-associated protein 2